MASIIASASSGLCREVDIEEYILQGRDVVSILLWGMMGTGKSSLVNGIIGKALAKEAQQPTAVTSEIESFTDNVTFPTRFGDKTIKVTVWDTPGLGDDDEEDMISNVIKRCKEVDLILFCIDMRTRLSGDAKKGIKLLTNRVGPHVWKHAVIALTFANEVRGPPGSDESPEELFTKLYSQWTAELIWYLGEHLLVPRDVIGDLSIVPTGYRQTQPPGHDDWLSCFWGHTFRKTKERAQPTLLGMNIHRIRSLSESQQGPSENQLEAYEQPINIDAMGLLKQRHSKAFVSFAVVGAGGGAVLGGAFGVLGGPLGIAAGTAAGGAFGFAVGGVCGIIVNAIQAYKSRLDPLEEEEDLEPSGIHM